MTESARQAGCIANRENPGEARGTGEYTQHNGGRLELLIDVESISSFTLHGPLLKSSLLYWRRRLTWKKKTVLQVVAGESIDLTMQLRRGQRPFTIKCIENLLNYTVVQAILLRATSECCLHNLFIFQAERGNIAV